jgi:EAL domain-containing protein (putative c-di-GMP-specific phosphodiesterase class I)
MPQVALNLSARQFRRPGNRQAYMALLQELSLGPAQVEFELTESNLFEDIDSPNSVVVALQNLGYTLSIDDFGTGYSSLGYLRRMRCGKLKIDRSFINGVSASADASSLVQSIISVAHALRLRVVAEGVEDLRDLAHLSDMQCDLYQGFGLGRPMSTEQVTTLMQQQASRDSTAGHNGAWTRTTPIGAPPSSAATATRPPPGASASPSTSGCHEHSRSG